MVNTRVNLSAYTGAPPEHDDADRGIPGGPIYTVEQVRSALALGETAINLWTRKCVRDVQRFEMDLEDVAELVQIALKSGRFKGSWWCENKPGGAWAACDSYQVFFRQWIEAAHNYMNFEYYIKFAVGRSGKIVLMVSCHPPEDRD